MFKKNIAIFATQFSKTKGRLFKKKRIKIDLSIKEIETE